MANILLFTILILLTLVASANSSDPKKLIRTEFQVTVAEIKKVMANSKTIKELQSDENTKEAFSVCQLMFDWAIQDIDRSLDKLGEVDMSRINEILLTLQVWLSGVFTSQQTCIDSYEEMNGTAAEKMKSILKKSQDLTKNGLAILNGLASLAKHLDLSFLNRKLLSSEFPEWMSYSDRRLLQTIDAVAAASQQATTAGAESSQAAAAPSQATADAGAAPKAAEAAPSQATADAGAAPKAAEAAPSQATTDAGAAPKAAAAPPSQATTDAGAAPKAAAAAPSQATTDAGAAPKAAAAAPSQATTDAGAAPKAAEAAPSQATTDAGAAPKVAAAPGDFKPDVIVAKDGSGKYDSVGKALAEIPKKNTKRFVILIKAGTYDERIDIRRGTNNIMFIGEGPTKTIITGSASVEKTVPKPTTFYTATVATSGMGFIAKDIAFENTIGPEGHQAVALRVSGDMAAFYNCHFNGYQDTLYAHEGRQFYRDCVITGTIDFIFGSARAVFQNSQVIVRKPMGNQKCIIIAQGKRSPETNDGFVFQNCTFSGDKDYLPVKDKNKTYLNRPWRSFATVVIMQSQIDDIIQPEGYIPMQGATGMKTGYFTEFGNRGPGSNTEFRARWPAIQQINPDEVKKFTPGPFLESETWVPSTGIPCIPDMIPGL